MPYTVPGSRVPAERPQIWLVMLARREDLRRILHSH
jgi:hypothetical protein